MIAVNPAKSGKSHKADSEKEKKSGHKKDK
jgi:hypothetical protein